MNKIIAFHKETLYISVTKFSKDIIEITLCRKCIFLLGLPSYCVKTESQTLVLKCETEELQCCLKCESQHSHNCGVTTETSLAFI